MSPPSDGLSLVAGGPVGTQAANRDARAGRRPRIAVVIDDFGTYSNNVPDDAWMQAPWPVTYAVMPRSPRTGEAAAATLRAGKELIVHFPFDPFLDLELPTGPTPSTSDASKVSALLEESIHSIPGAVGLNNHCSYRATQSRALMRCFMEGLRSRRLYFLDSRVSKKSVAYEEARRAGLSALANDVFLDEAKRHEKVFCMKMLCVAAQKARRRGSAVAIGHHYFHGTYEGLIEMVPLLTLGGFEFVFASQLLD